MLSKISRHTHNYIYILEFVMHTPLYNHIMIIRCELWRASARERDCCNTHPKNVRARPLFFSPQKKAQRKQTTLRCVRHSRKKRKQ